MVRRSFGVALIVTLLVWSVNLQAIACPALNSRATLMAQAAASPASKTEPSPSRHNCCPAQKVSSATVQLDRHCLLHAKSTLGCCSVTSNPQAARLPQILTRPNLEKLLGAAPPNGSPQFFNVVGPLFKLHSFATFCSTTLLPSAAPLSPSLLTLSLPNYVYV